MSYNQGPVSAANAHDEEHDYITHEGEPLKPGLNGADRHRHMGALEDNVTPVTPPVVGRAVVEDHDEDHHHVSPHSELTPG